MALPQAPGLTPAEVAFLCEMELITVIPRQRLESLKLLGGATPSLIPPHRSDVPLWLALLLKRQRRANIVAPPWMHPDALSAILEFETEHSRQAFSLPPKLPPAAPSSQRARGNDHADRETSRSSGALAEASSPPFVRSATADAQADALPYHWLELGQILLEAAADDVEDADLVQRLLRDLREVRMAKLRAGVKELDSGGGGGVKMNGVGAMEVAEGRGFIGGVVDGLRKIGKAREEARREMEREERENGAFEGGEEEGEDDDML